MKVRNGNGKKKLEMWNSKWVQGVDERERDGKKEQVIEERDW